MHVLLATPFCCFPYTNGTYFARAFSETEHTLTLWDWNLQSEPPKCNADVSFVLKGMDANFKKSIDLEKLPGKTLCLFPDYLQFFPQLHERFKKYDKVFTTPMPTPEMDWCEWAPGRYEPLIHREFSFKKRFNAMYIGTNNSKRKAEIVTALDLDLVCGNGWNPKDFKPGTRIGPAVYHFDYTATILGAKIAVCVFSPAWGPCPKPFEMCNVTFTLIEKVPGIPEIFGSSLLEKVGFTSVKDANEKIEYYLENEKERLGLWEKEKEIIKPYTYRHTIEQMLK